MKSAERRGGQGEYVPRFQLTASPDVAKTERREGSKGGEEMRRKLQTQRLKGSFIK